MKTILSILILLFSINNYATKQIDDTLIFEGKEYIWTGANPGYKYVEATNMPIPLEALATTANTRYILLTYTIENNLLYLSNIEILYYKDIEMTDLGVKSVFNYYFPSHTKILMEDYTHIQQIPYGETTGVDEYCLYDSYEGYLIFKYDKGKVIKHQNISYKELKKLRKKNFKKFKSTPQYEIGKIRKEGYYALGKDFCPDLTMDKYLEYTIFSGDIYYD